MTTFYLPTCHHCRHLSETLLDNARAGETRLLNEQIKCPEYSLLAAECSQNALELFDL